MLGDRVRYDAQLNYDPGLLAFIQQHFTPLAVCPEVEIGLSVPRPAVQLTQLQAGGPIRMTGRDDPTVDVSQAMRQYCQQRPAQLDSIHGYIFKSKSPSCGIQHIPVFKGEQIIGEDAGLFARAMMDRYRDLPIRDETQLLTAEQQDAFLQQVLQHQQQATQPND